ncbi:aspartyl-phosphate phosphatase Spo0E family protein [Mesobacillus maritimus]|uniref:Spo0E family sporulation regulatory protein-aspartic acid phosphatase n=1 Tax=Mesobacillus maritimus TaxID=1643336 RepID=UPI0020406110|nr:aspartyl-phosphate phosphatase Spo0E family protein [Mesobacillus maritimus]MCM3667560.1 aspartyl-phosphate phosphatase Spo0E family protein [Mesobacillus maritimus]
MREKNNPLLVQIQTKKEEMFACARETGFNSLETIACSQELDQLIYEYQLSMQNILPEKSKEKIHFRNLFWFFQNPKQAAGHFDS